MSPSFVIKEKIYPLVEKEISKPQSKNKFKEIVAAYMDKNIDKLSTAGPVYRTLFTDYDTGQVFNLLNIDPKQIQETLKLSNYIKGSWMNVSNPFNIVSAMIIRYAKISKDQALMSSAIMYLTLSMYPSLHYKYFKFQPNEEIMAYTVSTLNLKYKIKNTGTMWKALIETTSLSDATYTKNLLNCSDKDVTDYIQAFKTRLNSLLKNITNNFMKNHKAQNFLNMSEENDDPDNYKVADSNSYIIERMSNSISLKLSVSGADAVIVKLAAQLSNISINDLRNTVNDIIADKENKNDVRKMIESILYLYLNDHHLVISDIKSNNFLFFCLNIYKKTNITNKNIIFIKETLNRWLTKYSDTYKKTNRLATISNFKKALYLFFVISIQYNA